MIIEDMKKEGVDTARVQRVPGRSGQINGIVDRTGERALYAYPGVNRDLVLVEEDMAYLQGARFLHMSSFVGQGTFEAQKGLVRELSGVKLSLAPGALYASRGIEELGPLIEGAEVVFLNRDEMEALTGQGYKKGAVSLQQMGARHVVVTLGGEGCLIITDDGELKVKAFKTRVVDTTGAGDAFAAGFLFEMIKGGDIERAGRLGNLVASLCIAAPGARKGLPDETKRNHFAKF